MNPKFQSHIDAVQPLYTELVSADRVPIKPLASWEKMKAIYIFWDGENAIHAGRTRNLRSRIRGHISNSHYSASFVFKQTRLVTGLKATYKPENSRAALFVDPEFRAEFDRQMILHKSRKMSFLEVDDPIDQYFLELYAALELGLPLDEFDTH